MAYMDTNSTPILATVQDALNTLLTGFVDKVVLSSKRAQITQLTQALNRMDDTQLAQIGITRSEVPDYASMAIRVYG